MATAIIERPMDAATRSPIPGPTRPVRILRVIARLNMGGPSHHVGLLGSRLDAERYETLLLHGDVPSDEDSLEEAVRARGVAMARVSGLSPELRVPDDARALGSLVRAIRRLRPDILHTHTAKAGVLGRTAAVIAGERRPLVLHTYHGHVLEGYFGAARNCLYRGLERRLGPVSDALIGVSQATVDDLVRLGVAPRERFRVIPIGLELEPFIAATRANGVAFRQEASAADGDVLLTFVGRLAPVKRVDFLLRAFANARRLGAPVRLAIVGDGALRNQLESLARELGVRSKVYFAGYRTDMVAVAAASDIAVLTSVNEGTPVSLIEAAAAATPAVATRVGGVPDVVVDGTGVTTAPEDVGELGRALAELASDPETRLEWGANARRHVASRYSANRLVLEIEQLYEELMAQPRVTLAAGARSRRAHK